MSDRRKAPDWPTTGQVRRSEIDRRKDDRRHAIDLMNALKRSIEDGLVPDRRTGTRRAP